MNDREWLAEEFERHRPRLGAVAYRLLGSTNEAEDAVQDAWLRLYRFDTDSIDNLGGWLTTVVSRIALDMLRSRRRTEVSIHGEHPENPEYVSNATPEDEAVVSDSVGAALMLVLDSLHPPERIAFVLHDMFGIPFNLIGQVLERTPNAAKQLASRARHKVRGSDGPDRDPTQQRRVVDAFLDASRNGNFERLIEILDPEVVLQADPAAVKMGSSSEVRGAAQVAAIFSGRARGARLVTIDGAAAAAWLVGGQPRVVWEMTIVGGRIAHIEMLADEDHISELELGQ